MLRITNLLRSKVLTRAIQTRSGLPGWDRPDPPPTATVPMDHQLTDEEMIFFFPDRAMPEYIITEPEIYEGDRVREYGVTFIKYFGLFLTAAFFIGAQNSLGFNKKEYIPPTIYEIKALERYDKRKASGLVNQWANENPAGIKLTVNESKHHTAYFEGIRQRQQKTQKVNDDIKKYLTKIMQKAAKTVEERKSGSNAHGQESHEHHDKHHEKPAH